MTVLTGQSALVTGATSGIGQAIAMQLVDEGANVCLVGRRVDKLKSVSSSNIRHYQANLAEIESIEQLTNRVRSDLERLDILIHCAGSISLGRIEDLPWNEFDHQLRVNLRAPYLLTQSLLPMLRQQHGQVVFVNSSIINHVKATYGPYAASKCGLKAIADSLRDEQNAAGLRVMSIFPGCTATSMQAGIHEFEDRAYHPDTLIQPETVAEVVVDALKLPRDAELTDINIRPSKSPSLSMPLVKDRNQLQNQSIPNVLR